MSVESISPANRPAPENSATPSVSGTHSIGAALLAYFSAVSASVVAAAALIGAGVPLEILLATV